MWRVLKDRAWLVYVAILIASFSTFLVIPLKSQYVYMKVAESYNATTVKGQLSCYSNASTKVDELVSKAASRLMLVLLMTFFIPGSVVGFIVTSWSDKVGRKIAMTVPATGMILGSVSFAITIWFHWPAQTLFINSVVSGLSGYYMTFLLQGNAFLSDVSNDDTRGTLFVILDSCIGIGGGVAGIVSGFWLKAEGYFQPIVASGILSIIVLVLIYFFPDTAKIRQEMNVNEKNRNDTQPLLKNTEKEPILKNSSSGNNSNTNEHLPSKKSTFLELLRSVRNIYCSEYSHCEECHGPREPNGRRFEDRCCHEGGLYPGRIWRLWLYVLCDAIYLFVFVGTLEFQTIYTLSYPLCFTPVLVGAQVGLKFILLTMEPFVVIVLKRLFSMSNNTIILTGFIAFLLSTVTMSVATKPYMVFIAIGVMGPAFPAKPLIQAQMSSLVSQHEQGSTYGLLSFTETMMYLVSSITFLTIYPATINIFRGFAWLFAAFLVFIAAVMMTIITVIDRRRQVRGVI